MNGHVSLIVASYNQPRTLALVLEGGLRQSVSDFEVVVADGGLEADLDYYESRAGTIRCCRELVDERELSR